MRKLFLKWVPCLLTPDQKQQRVEDPERCLELFNRGKKDFLRRYVTMDETWIHHCTLETKRSLAGWTAAGESCPKLLKTQQWAGNVMASVFRDEHGILFIDYIEKGKTIKSDYCMALLDLLSAEIEKNGLTWKKSAVPPRKCTVPQVYGNDAQIEWIKFRIASSPTMFSRSDSQRLLALC